MATLNTLPALNAAQDLEQQLPTKEVVNLLNEWFRKLDNPKQPEGLVKKLQISEFQSGYFELLEESLRGICDSKLYPPSLSKPYLEQLCSKNNPYDFTETLELAVDATLHFEDLIDPKKTFFLYYFHRQQLQDAASKKWFSTGKQIGRVWA